MIGSKQRQEGLGAKVAPLLLERAVFLPVITLLGVGVMENVSNCVLTITSVFQYSGSKAVIHGPHLIVLV